MTDDPDLAALAQAATPGLWEADAPNGDIYSPAGAFVNIELLIARTTTDTENHEANAAYIAAASPDAVLALIRERDEWQVRCAELEAVAQTFHHDWTFVCAERDTAIRERDEARARVVEHGYGDESDCLCGRNFKTVRGLREHLTKSRKVTDSDLLLKLSNQAVQMWRTKHHESAVDLQALRERIGELADEWDVKGHRTRSSNIQARSAFFGCAIEIRAALLPAPPAEDVPPANIVSENFRGPGEGYSISRAPAEDEGGD